MSGGVTTKARPPRTPGAAAPPRDVRLVVAPSAARRRAEAQAWIEAHPADRELLVIGASWEACDEIVRDVVRAGGVRFGVVRSTLGRVAGLLAAPALAGRGQVPASGLSLDAVAARAVHQLRATDALTYFTPVADRPGFPLAVGRTMEELRLSSVSPAALAALPTIGHDLEALATETARELADAGLADRAAVFAAATAAAAAATAPPPVGLPLLMLDVAVATAGEAALVASLARRAPAVLATVPTGDARTRSLLERALASAATPLAPSSEPAALARLQTHLFETSTPTPAPLDESVTLHSWPGEARECVEIARRIHEEAARGVPFDRMAIFLHAPREYTAHLEEALRRADVPAHFARGTTRPDPAGRALLALLACAAEGLSARRFAEYLSLAQVPDAELQRERGAAPAPLVVPADEELLPPAIADRLADAALAAQAVAERDDPLPRDPHAEAVVAGTVATPWRWEQLLVDAAVIGGRDRWAERLDGLRREIAMRRAELGGEDEARAAQIDGLARQLEHLQAYAMPLIARLDELRHARSTWGEWLGRLRELAAQALRDPIQVLATLAELEPMAPVGPVALDEVQQVLGSRLRSLTVRPSRRRYGAVFVAPTEAARGLAFDVVFVPGLAERLFPRKIVEDPILLDASRERLGGLADGVGLVTQGDRVSAERLALRLAVGAARERIVVSYPRIDVEQGRPRVPSFYALEALRAAEGLLPGFEEIALRARERGEARLGWPAPERAEQAIDDAEYDLALLAPLLDVDPKTTIGTARYLLGANVHLARALRARAHRWWKRWTPADGLVDPDELGRAALAAHQLSARSYSPTALQNFAACPYRFFLQAVHRLKPREEPVAIEVLDPLTRGSLFHEVQFAVLSRLRAEELLPVRPDNLTRALDHVDGILDAVAGRYRDELAPAIPRVWEDGINSIRADLREWLRRASQEDDGWVPDRFELAFGLADARAGRRRSRQRQRAGTGGGDADAARLDRSRRASSARRAPGDRPQDRQGAGHGRRRRRRRRDPAARPLRARVRAPPARARRGGTPLLLHGDRRLRATGRGPRRAQPCRRARRGGGGGRALVDGFLPAAPLERGCPWCDYRPVCGPYEEVRVKRKPRERLAALTRLRSMP